MGGFLTKRKIWALGFSGFLGPMLDFKIGAPEGSLGTVNRAFGRTIWAKPAKMKVPATLGALFVCTFEPKCKQRHEQRKDSLPG